MNLETIKAKLQSLNTDKVEEVSVVYPTTIDCYYNNTGNDIIDSLHSLISVEFSDDIPLYNHEGKKTKTQLIVTPFQHYEMGYHVDDEHVYRIVPVVEIDGELFEKLDRDVPFYLNKEVYDYLTSEEVTSYLNSEEFLKIYQEFNR